MARGKIDRVKRSEVALDETEVVEIELDLRSSRTPCDECSRPADVATREGEYLCARCALERLGDRFAAE